MKPDLLTNIWYLAAGSAGDVCWKFCARFGGVRPQDTFLFVHEEDVAGIRPGQPGDGLEHEVPFEDFKAFARVFGNEQNALNS